MTAAEAPNLEPEFRKLLVRLEQLLRAKGLKMRITCGYRSMQEQARLCTRSGRGGRAPSRDSRRTTTGWRRTFVSRGHSRMSGTGLSSGSWCERRDWCGEVGGWYSKTGRMWRCRSGVRT